MLEAIKKFFVGTPPTPDDNRLFYGPEEPKKRAGLLFWPQLAKGDIWVNDADSNTTYYFDGQAWDKVTS